MEAMEGILPVTLLPLKSYNRYSALVLFLFVSIGVVLIGFASDFDSKSSLHCDINESVASNLAKRKYIETQCLLKYEQEFLPSLPLHVLTTTSFVVVLVLSVIYGYLVKDRVENVANNPNTTNEGVEERQTLAGMSLAATYQGTDRYFVFIAHIMHLLFRILSLIIFSAILLKSSNFPTQFHCPLPMRTTSPENITRPSTNDSFVECVYPMGKKNVKVVASVITINFLFGAVTVVELVHLLRQAYKYPSFRTDQEFISVYLLGKCTKPIPEINQRIRENQSKYLFEVRDELGEKRLSYRKLEEIYINVLIQDDRESTENYRKEFRDRHEIYVVQLAKPSEARMLMSTAELFQAANASDKAPKTVLVVGRPGIGKTVLTKKIFNEWQKGKASIFWHEKIVILIRFRDFNKGKTSLQEILSRGHGVNTFLANLENMTIYEFICQKQNNAILVFDGLDKLEIDKECLADSKTVKGLEEKAHMFVIFKQLVKGELLPEAKVLVTSRPTAEDVYDHENLAFDRHIEVLGFNEKQIKMYVEKLFCNNRQKGSEIWEIIKNSPELLSFCYIPVNSEIVCLTLNESIICEQLKNKIPKTMTEMYKRAIKVLLCKHNSKCKNENVQKNYLTANLPEELQKDLEKLKKVAIDGMKKNQFINYKLSLFVSQKCKFPTS